MPCKERVFAIEGNGADYSLDNVAVHLDGAVIKEQLQAVDVFCDVAELLTQAQFCGDAGSLGFKPYLKTIHRSHMNRSNFLSRDDRANFWGV